MPVDLLVFGPHPDDLEIGLGGTIARHVADGFSVGLCDLTAGELGSNGTADERKREAADAARVLGAAWRTNLEWPDGGIVPSPEILRSAVELLRRERPKAVALPYWEDRHPDHGAASRVLDLAVFRSALRRYETDLEPWRPEWVCYYFINDSAPPSFVVDVSAHYATKRAALACHRSQFAPADASAVPTRLTASTFTQLIESRDAQFGAQAGVAFAEGLIVREPVKTGPTKRALASPRERSGAAGPPRVSAKGGFAGAKPPGFLGGPVREDRHHLLRLGWRQRRRGHRVGARAR